MATFYLGLDADNVQNLGLLPNDRDEVGHHVSEHATIQPDDIQYICLDSLKTSGSSASIE